MRNISFLYHVLFLVGAIVVAPCYAEQETDDADLGEFIEGQKWKEGDIVVPPFPKTDDLLKVEVDRAESPFNFYIDSKSLSISPDKGVIRYTVVIESDSGAQNILFEGIRCQTREFRTYAYGTYDKKLVKARTSEWKLIQEKTGVVHRYNFYRHYMCSEYLTPNPIDILLQKVKYPEDFQEAGENEY
ncbi:MAG: CNP1-like family protein [Sulfuriflexus sp.]|nr:CNP1-like family protein [Sulfuriflexus sp.]